MRFPRLIPRIHDTDPSYRETQALADIEAIKQWEADGRPVPPPYAIKRQRLRAAAQRRNLRTLIETGTYLGNTIYSLQDDFDTLHSIELSRRLYWRARWRFRNNPAVHLHRGDSAVILPKILASLTAPALLWLDAHYSHGFTARGDIDSPVAAELQVIAQSGHLHSVLIDDARCFTGRGGYPHIDSMSGLVAALLPHHDYVLADDIFELTPRT